MNSVVCSLGDVEDREERARRPPSELRRRIGERAGAVRSALSASFAAGDGERHTGRPISQKMDEVGRGRRGDVKLLAEMVVMSVGRGNVERGDA
jgi:hypothetical protein